MCSFLLTTLVVHELLFVNELAARRGPDATTWLRVGPVDLVHNLLQVTGDPLIQPIVLDGLVLLYNGELYGYEEYCPACKSDGEAILPLYLQYGLSFVKHLRGEFALAILDLARKRLVLATDLFRTKPLWLRLAWV